jgi:hypothetical protein
LIGSRSSPCSVWKGTAIVGERHDASSRGPSAQRHTEERQKLSSIALGDLIASVKQALGQKCEHLDQRDSGIAAIEVGPLGIVDGNPRERLVEQVGVTTVVDRGDGERHRRLTQRA